MKLDRLEHSLTARIKLRVAGLVVGERAPDVLRVILYRPELFGRASAKWTQKLLRGPSPWTVAERELMAAVVSDGLNQSWC